MTLGMLFLFTGFYLLLPTLPLYIKQLGGSDPQVGLAAGAFTLSAVIFRPIVGGLLDRHGRRPFVLWGLALFALSMYLYDWVGGFVVLLALRLIHGVSWAFSTTAVGTAITDLIPVKRRGEGMGWYGMAMTVSMAIGPMLGIWVLQHHSFHGLFLFAAGLSIVALVLAIATPMPFEAKASEGRIEFFEKAVLPVAVVIVFLTVAYGATITFLPLFAESMGANPGSFFLVYAIAITLVRPVAGKLSDRHGEMSVIVPATVVTMMALLVLSFSTGLRGLIMSAVLYGIGFGSAQPALQAATLSLVPPHRTGVANASFFTAFDLGIALGSIALGWVSQFMGYRALFLVGAGSVAVSLLVLAVYVKPLLRRRRSVQTES